MSAATNGLEDLLAPWPQPLYQQGAQLMPQVHWSARV
jgi:hypothetical protein